MKDSIPNTLRDLQIAKPVYYKNYFIVLHELQSYETPTQQAEKVTVSLFSSEMNAQNYKQSQSLCSSFLPVVNKEMVI